MIDRKEFDAMPVSCRRMALAEDIIAQIEAGNIIPTQREYVVPRTLSSAWVKNSGMPPWHEVPFREVDQEVLTSDCHVCAIGAAFVCAVNSGMIDPGKIVAENLQHKSFLENKLRDIFDRETLNEMEMAFEAFGSPRTSPELVKARLIGIMRNVIANGGEFKRNWKSM